MEEVFENHKHETQKQKEKDKSKSRKLKALGFEGDHGGEAILWSLCAHRQKVQDLSASSQRTLFATAKVSCGSTQDLKKFVEGSEYLWKRFFNDGIVVKMENGPYGGILGL